MRELALHLLDIAENSVSANADTIQIEIEEAHTADRLRIRVIDNGAGMTPELAARVTDPFVTSRTTRKVGLGIPLLKAAAEACCGGLTLQSALGKGTCVTIEFQLSHIDRMPLGDLTTTMLALIVGSPDVHWILRYTVDGQTFIFNDEEIKDAAGDLPLSEPAVLGYLRNTIDSGITAVNASA